ncbi:hypothetical protein FOA52_011903 [Chlamydomonas sp. UWO 241]|nr:hypothetical protein FOA52_011903 [Chlamydomonas sp. UWO 241]
MEEPLTIIILDDSEAAHQSEDFGTSRWAFQVQAAMCLCKAFGPLAHGSGAAAALGAGSRDPTGGSSRLRSMVKDDEDDEPLQPRERFAVLGSAQRARVLMPPSADTGPMHALRDAAPVEGGCQLAQALKVALLTARQRHSTAGGPTHVVAFVASGEAALGAAAAIEQLAEALVGARVRLDVAVLGSPDEVARDTVAALEALAGAINSRVAAAGGGAPPHPPSAAPAQAAPPAAASPALTLQPQPQSLRRPPGQEAPPLLPTSPPPAQPLPARRGQEAPPSLPPSPQPQPPPPGSRVVYVPAPAPGALPPLWQQLEPLLELMGGTGRDDAEEGGEADSDDDGDGDEFSALIQRARRALDDTFSGIGTSEAAGGRPPGVAAAAATLPLGRPPRAPAPRVAAAAAAPAAAGGAAATAGISSSALRGGLARRARGGAPPPRDAAITGPLIRGRSHAPSICRDESLDCLQHLSGDGFQRPWLPSYANVGKALESARSASPSGAPPGKYVYLSVYRVTQKKWRAVLSVPAGRMLPVAAASTSAAGVPGGRDAGEGAAAAPAPAAVPTATATTTTTTTDFTASAAGDDDAPPGLACSSSDDDSDGPFVPAPKPKPKPAPAFDDDDDAPEPAAMLARRLRASAAAHPCALPPPPPPFYPWPYPPLPASPSAGVEGLAESGAAHPCILPPPPQPYPYPYPPLPAGPSAGVEPGTLPAPPRPHPMPPYPMPHAGLSTGCSPSFGPLLGASCSGGGNGSVGTGCVSVAPDSRVGTLRLIVSSASDSNPVVKLTWTAGGPPPQGREATHRSLFEMAAAAAGGGAAGGEGVDDVDLSVEGGGSGSTARPELELTLSGTRTRFAAVPGTGNRVLEVRGVSAMRTHTSRAASTSAPSTTAPTAKPVLGPDAHPRFLFWVDAAYASREGGLGGRGAFGLADDLQALLECPPDAPAVHSGVGSRPMGTPVKLGPLPRQLLEDLVRGMGRQLLPDGRIAPIGVDTGGASIDAWDEPGVSSVSIGVTSGSGGTTATVQARANAEAERARAARAEAREQERWRMEQQAMWRERRRALAATGPLPTATAAAQQQQGRGNGAHAAVGCVSRAAAGPPRRRAGAPLHSHALYDIDDSYNTASSSAGGSAPSTPPLGAATPTATGDSGGGDDRMPSLLSFASAGNPGPPRPVGPGAAPGRDNDNDSLLFDLD